MKQLIAFYAALTLFAVLTSAPAKADEIGQVFVCYSCQNTGNAAIDAALAANPGVASDGILFAFINTSNFAITGGSFSVSNASPDDSFAFPTIAADSTYILIPGVTSDGSTHPSGGLFDATGVKDTSDGAGGLTDNSIFSFVGSSDSFPVTSLTAGSSTAIPGTFTPADPGLFLPYRDNPAAGSTSFIGDGPNGDPGCNNCYYGMVATLDTPGIVATPEPASAALLLIGCGAMGWMVRRGVYRKV